MMVKIWHWIRGDKAEHDQVIAELKRAQKKIDESIEALRARVG